MKPILPLSLFLAGTVVPGMGHAQGANDSQSGQQPNIILFMVDDMGWQETSVPFYKDPTLLNKRYRTPNMELMASKGVKFMQAYACAISSPSRCSLMSGMNAARHRVTNWTLEYNVKTDAPSQNLILPDWNYNGIQPAALANEHDLNQGTPITSFTEILNEHGYYTIHCGKAHFGSQTTTGADPETFGFDVNIAGGANGGPGSYLASNEYGSGSFHVSGLEKYHGTDTFLTEALTIEALNALKDPIARKQPFYLYMAHYAIHTPYDADPRFTGNYRNKVDEMLGAQLSDSEINHAALVEGMDKSLGDIMKFLDSMPEVAQNTIILFMSDNGGQAVWPRQGRLNRDQNYPARGGKGSAYEGGVHEPMMVYWPGNKNIVPGSENQSRIMIEDFFPTILDLAGIKDYKTVQKVDGKSFADILRDPSIERSRVNIWHFPNLWGESQDKNEGYGAYSAIMKGDYHMIYFWESQERRLYNIKEDIGETNNLAKAMPELLDELSKELTDSLKAYDAQRPSYKESGEIIPWPDEAPAPAEQGDVVTPTAAIFRYSTEDTKYYYRILDNRAETNFKWTLGKHNGYNAIQATSEQYADVYDATQQYFYFEQGSDENHFRMFTVDGKNIDYVDGKTGSSWNGGNIGDGVTTPYMQYGTATSGEFQLIATGTMGRYAIKTPNGDLLNTRGTGNGTAANMKWVINTYSGITVTDPGSMYKFVAVPGNSIADLITTQYENYKKHSDYVGAHDASSVDEIYQEAMRSPDLEDLKQMKEAYETSPILELEPNKLYRIRNYMRKISTGNTACNGTGGYMETIDINNPDHDLCKAEGGFSAIDADNTHCNALWLLEEGNESGTFRLRNVNSGTYISAGNVGSGHYATSTTDPEKALILKAIPYGDLQYKLAVASDNSLRLHISGQANSGNSARLMLYNAEDKNTASAWYLIHARNIDVTMDSTQYGNLASVYLPVGIELPEGVTAHQGRMENEELVLTEIENTVPAHTGMVLKGNSKICSLPITTASIPSIEGNELCGSSVFFTKENGTSIFMLETNDGNALFNLFTDSVIPGNKAYLNGREIVAPNGIGLRFDDATGITQMEADSSKSSITYDLMGRKVNQPKKGVYIQNGQKIIY